MENPPLWPVSGLTKLGRRRVSDKFRDALQLYDNIKAEGLRAPLEMYADNGALLLWKGYRRLAVLHALGVKEVPCMIHQSWDRRQWDMSFFPSRKRMMQAGPIVKRAGDHFAEMGGDCTDKYWVHAYTTIYDQLFAEFLSNPVKILELGVLRGASLRLWHDVFPAAKIFGLDRDGDKWRELAGDCDRVQMLVGNQRDSEFMQTVAQRGWHVIIDDCSHDPRIQRTTFDTLWPSVKSNGLYVIEDCHYSYDSRYKRKGNFVEHIASLVPRIYTSGDVAEVEPISDERLAAIRAYAERRAKYLFTEYDSDIFSALNELKRWRDGSVRFDSGTKRDISGEDGGECAGEHPS
jgi:hypothetical protein